MLPTFDEKSHASNLIRTTSERSSLLQKQGAEYLQSLAMDEEKENVKKKKN